MAQAEEAYVGHYALQAGRGVGLTCIAWETEWCMQCLDDLDWLAAEAEPRAEKQYSPKAVD